MANFCENCGNALTANTRFCDRCGMQTDAEQAAIQAEQTKNADEARTDKGMGGTIGLTVIMAIFSVFVILLIGFDSTGAIIGSCISLAFPVFITIVKWVYEIKFQRRLKKEAMEKAEKGLGIR